jgi:hypothetical protein
MSLLIWDLTYVRGTAVSAKRRLSDGLVRLGMRLLAWICLFLAEIYSRWLFRGRKLP